jgi:hypothetical protein
MYGRAKFALSVVSLVSRLHSQRTGSYLNALIYHGNKKFMVFLPSSVMYTHTLLSEMCGEGEGMFSLRFSGSKSEQSMKRLLV